jgi:transposase InsO family protein
MSYQTGLLYSDGPRLSLSGRGYGLGQPVRAGLAYFEFYNYERLHQALGYRAPRRVFEQAPRVAQAPARQKNRRCRPVRDLRGSN